MSKIVTPTKVSLNDDLVRSFVDSHNINSDTLLATIESSLSGCISPLVMSATVGSTTTDLDHRVQLPPGTSNVTVNVVSGKVYFNSTKSVIEITESLPIDINISSSKSHYIYMDDKGDLKNLPARQSYSTDLVLVALVNINSVVRVNELMMSTPADREVTDGLLPAYSSRLVGSSTVSTLAYSTKYEGSTSVLGKYTTDEINVTPNFNVKLVKYDDPYVPTTESVLRDDILSGNLNQSLITGIDVNTWTSVDVMYDLSTSTICVYNYNLQAVDSVQATYEAVLSRYHNRESSTLMIPLRKVVFKYLGGTNAIPITDDLISTQGASLLDSGAQDRLYSMIISKSLAWSTGIVGD